MTPEELHAVWSQEPTTQNLRPVLDSMKRVLDYAVGGLNNAGPQAKHQARLYAADAIRSYDPAAGTSLSTHVQNGLQQLKRYNRTTGGAVKVADRTSLDAFAIEKANAKFIDTHGREPTVQELSDETKMSPSRIGKVRRQTRPVASQDQMGDAALDAPDFLDEATAYIYEDSDYIDKKIIEMTTGYGGAQMVRKNADMAAKLNIHPSQVTRRSARIRAKVQEIEQGLEDLS